MTTPTDNPNEESDHPEDRRLEVDDEVDINVIRADESDDTPESTPTPDTDEHD